MADRDLMNSAKETLEVKGVRLEKSTLNDILSSAQDIAGRAEDFMISSKKVVSTAGDEYGLQIDGEDYEVNGWAIAYICNTFGIPKSFLNKVLSRAVMQKHEPFSNLVNTIINEHIQAPDLGREWLIRVIDENKVRAIRSSRFFIRDNYPLLESCMDTLNEHYVLSSGFVDEDIMILRLYLKDSFMVKGHKVKIGVQMRNSETGYYALQLKVLINISGVEFTSAVLASVRHNTRLVESFDMDKYLLSMATEKKDEVFDKMKDLITNDDLDNRAFQNFLTRLEAVINKKDYEMIVSLSPSKKKTSLTKTVLNTVADYNFDKKEDVENLINDAFYKISMTMFGDDSAYDENGMED